jgi:hypothetical protein
MSLLRNVLLIAGMTLGAPCLATTIRCDNCSEATYQSRASAPGTGLGERYVYDVPQGIARKFHVGLECDDNLGDGRTRCTRVATPLPVEPEVDAFLIELAAYYVATGGTMKSHFTFVASPPITDLSAFDVVGPGAPQQRLFDWFWVDSAASISNTLPGVGAAAHQILVTIGSMWNDSMGRTNVTIEFADGSEITLSFEAINGTVDVVPGSARDALGNVIPATTADIDGTRFDYSYDPTGDLQQRMIDYLESLGASFSGEGRKWACVKVGEHEWECTFQ